jgi:hypothetical protein
MRAQSLILVVAIAAVAFAAPACSYTSDGGITGRIESSSETTVESAVSSWDSEPIAITSSEGSIEVVGVPGKTNIAVHARFVAGANSQSDADAAFADLASLLSVTKSDSGWVVKCPHATSSHGSAAPLSTGCASMRVEVPAGTAVPLQISASSEFGGVHVSGVTVAKLDVSAPFGIVADVVPTNEADITLTGLYLVTGMCSTVLRVPAATRIGAATLTVDNPSLKYVGVADDDQTYWLGAYVEGFPNPPQVPVRSGSLTWSQGMEPFAAKSITLHASLGKALLTTKSESVPAYDPRNECVNMDLKVVATGGATSG